MINYKKSIFCIIKIFLKAFAQFYIFFSTVLATEYNRVLIFKGPIEGKMLPGNVIRTENVANEGSCRVRCFLEPNCVSVNVGPANDQGKRACELKNFTDESPSQTGLQQRTGHIHYSAEVSDIYFCWLSFMLVILKRYSRNGNSFTLDTTKTADNQRKKTFGWQQFHLIKRNLLKQ